MKDQNLNISEAFDENVSEMTARLTGRNGNELSTVWRQSWTGNTIMILLRTRSDKPAVLFASFFAVLFL